jgi:hypothetical protein
MGVRVHDVGKSPNKTGLYCWQFIPYHTTDRAIDPDVYTSHLYQVNGKFVQPSMLKGENAETVSVIGSYIRVGFVHEYASIGNAAQFERRNELSVSRDITYLISNGAIRPLQFYLWLDDQTKLV